MRNKTLATPRFAKLGFAMAVMMAAPMAAIAQDSPEVQAERQALNGAQAKLAADQIAEFNAQKQAATETQAVAETAYRSALAAYDAEVAASKQKAADDQAKWEAAVIACKNGDRKFCAPKQKRTD